MLKQKPSLKKVEMFLETAFVMKNMETKKFYRNKLLYIPLRRIDKYINIFNNTITTKS